MSDRIGFDRIIGQDLAKQVLMRAVREDTPSHAYLFLGLHGIGKALTAVEFTRALNCERPVDGNACGECAICNSIEHGNFPDMRIWSPDGQNTKIEQMREMRDLAPFRPMRGRWKVNIIEQGDTLNEESANAILKLLEEPPDYLINILIYRNSANILGTIRSRCQLIRFPQVHADVLAERLVQDFGAEQTKAEFLATYSQGCPGVAIGLLSNDDFFARRNEIISVARAASLGNPWPALRMAGVLRGSSPKAEEAAEADDDAPKAKKSVKANKGVRDATTESLDMLLLWYRDLLAVKLQGSDAAIVNSDKRDEIIEQCAKYRHAGPLATAVELILQAKRSVHGNANAQITTEALMMRLMAA